MYFEADKVDGWAMSQNLPDKDVKISKPIN